MQELSREYIESKFMALAGSPKRTSDGNYNGKCVHCHEGKSWKSKSRLYYLADANLIYCHNCGKTWKPAQWIAEVENKSVKDILLDEYDEGYIPKDRTDVKKRKEPDLPYDSINLFDEINLTKFKNNGVVDLALKFIKDRRLDTAINNRPLYLSLKDYIHKNRIIIPFQNTAGKVIYYQSRKLLESEDSEKYLSKAMHGEGGKELYGLDKIDLSFPYIFVFEGPLDSMFMKNGVAVGGLTMTEHQRNVLNGFITHQVIWVLDNQNVDKASKDKTVSLLKKKQSVFIWPKVPYKDFNEMCVKEKKDFVEPDFILSRVARNEIEMFALS